MPPTAYFEGKIWKRSSGFSTSCRLLEMKKKEKALSKILIKPLIKTIRSRKVILDSDLAKIYGVSTKRLNEQVKRNADRFPADFAFQLAPEEVAILRS